MFCYSWHAGIFENLCQIHKGLSRDDKRDIYQVYVKFNLNSPNFQTKGHLSFFFESARDNRYNFLSMFRSRRRREKNSFENEILTFGNIFSFTSARNESVVSINVDKASNVCEEQRTRNRNAERFLHFIFVTLIIYLSNERKGNHFFTSTSETII